MKLGRYIVGLISGLTFGMLFAPKKGKRLREELISKGSESGHDALLVLYNAFKDAGTDAVGEMKKLSESEQLQSALSMSKDKMREYLSEIEETGYDLAARTHEKVDEFSDKAMQAGAQFKKRAVKKKKAIKKVVKARVKKAAKSVPTRRKKAAPKRRVTTKRRTVSRKK